MEEVGTEVIAVLCMLAALVAFALSFRFQRLGRGYRVAAVLFLVAGWIMLAAEILAIWG